MADWLANNYANQRTVWSYRHNLEKLFRETAITNPDDLRMEHIIAAFCRPELAANTCLHASRGCPIVGLFVAVVGGFFAVAMFPFGLLIPHFWVGLYFAFGHLWVDAAIRRHTSYAVTQRRAMLVRRWPWYRSTAINLMTVPEINVVHHRDGTGTISFGSFWNRFARQASLTHHTPSFEYIDDVDHVARLVHIASLGHQGGGRED